MKNYKSIRFDPDGFGVNNVGFDKEYYLRYRTYVRNTITRKEKGVKIQVSPNK